MEVKNMSYSKCTCRKCGSQFATSLQNDIDVKNEPCPSCGEKQLQLSGKLSFSEINSLFYGGG
jgi:Zn finger protein HypA/HybF involved in hydrogenase expression